MLRDLATVRSLPGLVHGGHDDLNEDTLTIPEIMAFLRSPDAAEREEALAELAEQVDSAFGYDGLRLGEALRGCGGLPTLAWLLADPTPEVVQQALCILGNLCSDTVDPNSTRTKQALLPNARSVLACVYTEDENILLVACGALQNLCSDREWAEAAVAHDAHLRLESLCMHADGRIVRYASGALKNISSSLQLSNLSRLAMDAIELRAVEHEREERVQQRARGAIARAIARMPLDRRRRRHESGLRRRHQMDTDSNASSSTWSYEIGPYVRSRNASRPASACSHASSHASFASAKSVPPPGE